MSQAPLEQGQALMLVRQMFAQADIVSFRPFPGQHATANYDLQIANPTMNVAIKFYLDLADQKPWKEVQLLRLLTSETGVPAPRVLHFDESNALAPYPWILCTRLSGQPLADVLDEMDVWELEAIGYEMGRYLAHIHQIPLTAFGEFFVADADCFINEQEFVLHRLNQALHAGTASKLWPAETANELMRLFEQTQVFDLAQARLIHGDYTEHNVIVEGGMAGWHVAGIVDLKQAIGSSPEDDMGKLFNGVFGERETLQKGFLDGYTEWAEIKVQFWERIRLYRILTCIEQILTAHEKNEPVQEQQAVLARLARLC